MSDIIAIAAAIAAIPIGLAFAGSIIQYACKEAIQ